MHKTAEHFYAAELYRLRGELRLRQAAGNDLTSQKPVSSRLSPEPAASKPKHGSYAPR